MAAPACVYTLARVARMLGMDETLFANIALMNMAPEDGCLAILDLDDDTSTTGFTPFGVECLEELLADIMQPTSPK